ncbi:hypothetical protein [Streptomyces sp. NPDC007083]|uniref:hypothetical protein n=1 Tax=unclassified Streptomyces TaxID=2593676 RepID=UPI0033E64DDD
MAAPVDDLALVGGVQTAEPVARYGSTARPRVTARSGTRARARPRPARWGGRALRISGAVVERARASWAPVSESREVTVWVRKVLAAVWRALSTYGLIWVVPHFDVTEQEEEEQARSTLNKGGLEKTTSSSRQR